MRVGLAYDLKTEVTGLHTGDDALEEYDSPETLAVITAAIEARGDTVVRLGGGCQFLENIRREPVDIVFNIAEGRGNYRSREAQVPAVLEMLDIPYTGSDPQTLAVCLDKPVTKKLVAADGVRTPRWLLVSGKEDFDRQSWKGFAYPAIVKPAYEGSSKGVRLTSLAHNETEAREEAHRVLEAYGQPVLVEEFIDGDEVTVGIIGNSPPVITGMMRILPRRKEGHFIYSLEVKRDYLNLVDYECPARLDKAVLDEIAASSLRAFGSLGCRDFTRVDFRLGPDGTPYFIEINPLPGLGTYSDLIIMAKMMGRSHHEIIVSVLDAAIERYPQCVNV